jgi:hypothetical protein
VNRSRQTDPHLQIYQSRRKVRSKDRLQSIERIVKFNGLSAVTDDVVETLVVGVT